MSDQARRTCSEPAANGALDGSVQVQSIQKIYSWQRPGYGKQPKPRLFSKAARRLVSEACQVLDDAWGKSTYVLSGTLPGSTREAAQALSAESSYVHGRLRQWFRDRLPGCGVVFVWEFQRRGALHCHIALGFHMGDRLKAVLEGFHEYWRHLLDLVSLRSGVDLFARASGGSWRDSPDVLQTDVAPVRKSVGRYLAKYLSKSAKAAKKLKRFPPAAWYGISDNLRQEVYARRKTVVTPLMPLIVAYELFERCGGVLQAGSRLCFAYKNRYRAADMAVVSLSLPEVGSNLFREVALQLESATRALWSDRVARDHLDALNGVESRLLAVYGERKLSVAEEAVMLGAVRAA